MEMHILGAILTKSKKIRIIAIIISVIMVVACFSLMIRVHTNSRVVAYQNGIAIYYDDVADEYYLNGNDSWNIFKMEYRDILDYEIAKEYVDAYQELMTIDLKENQ